MSTPAPAAADGSRAEPPAQPPASDAAARRTRNREAGERRDGLAVGIWPIFYPPKGAVVKFAPAGYHSGMNRLPKLMRIALFVLCAGAPMIVPPVAAAQDQQQPRQPATQPNRLRVMTYNIHHGEGTDKKLDLQRLAAIIKQADVDVVAIQEVDNRTDRTGKVDQAAELGRLTGMRAQFGGAMPYQGGEYGQAILSRHPMDDLEVIRLPQTVSTEPRIAVAATIRPAGARPFRFVGTHLSAARDDSERELQAKALAEALAKDRSLPTILVGDMNAAPGSQAIANLGVGETWQDTTPDDAFTSGAERPYRKIDWVLLSKPAAWKVVDAKVPEEPTASDHRPVVVELEWVGGAR